MKKLYSAIVCLLYAAIGWSQSDSVIVNLSDAEVVFITRDEVASLIERPDSLLLQAMPLLSLSESLEQFSSLRLRTYGPKGSLVSGIGNGLSSDHLAVLWNGVPVSSPSLGSTDLSSIASGQFTNINVSRGYTTTLTSAATGAGAIHLNSGSTQKNHIAMGINSIQNTAVSGSFGYSIGRNLQMSTNIQVDDAQNEFQYEDPFLLDRLTRNQHHNNYKRNSLIQFLEWRPKESTAIDAALWVQNSSLNLPSILGSLGNSFATQRDSSLRVNVGFTRYFERWKLQVRNAYLTDGQHYRDFMTADSEPFIDSRIQTFRWFHQAIGDLVWKGCEIQLAVSHQNDFAKTSNYSEARPTRKTTGAQVRFSKQLNNWNLSASGRYDFGTVGDVFVPNARLAYVVKNHSFSARYDRLFRYPDMNELFWRPGGSIALHPEVGHRYTLGWSFDLERKKIDVCSSLSVSYQNMEELILWVNTDGVFTAQNIQNVQNAAVEGTTHLSVNIGPFGINQTLNFSYQVNEGLSELEKDFFFDFTSRYALQVTKGRWFISGNARYTVPDWNRGSLNTVRGNQEQLLMFDSFIGANFDLANTSLGVSVTCVNVTDIMDYRNTNAATAGRVIGLNLMLKWNTRN